MAIVLLIFKLIPTILALVKVAEDLYQNKPKSGQEKKEFVLSIVQALIGGASEVFTGGAADTWNILKDPISMLIDAAAALKFPNEPGTAGEGL